jgi:hypothetical protein
MVQLAAVRVGSRPQYLRGLLLGLLLLAPGLAAAQAGTDRAAIDWVVVRAARICEQKRCEDALDDLERANAVSPPRADLQLLLGEALYWHRRFPEALDHYARAVELEPTMAPAYRGIGFSCYELSFPEWNHPSTRLRWLDHAFWAFQIARLLDPTDVSASEGAAKVAKELTPDGRPLAWLADAIAALLVLLCIAVGWRLRRARLRNARAWLYAYRAPLLLFVLTRALVLGAFAIAPAVIEEGPPHPPQLLHHHDFVLDAVASRWDSNFYLDVAARGYRIEPTGGPGRWSTVGQFPLLPVLFYWTAHALDSRHVAALIVPHLALLFACVFLYAHFRERYGERTALLSLGVLLLHPASVYGSVLYTEPLALLGLVAAVYALEHDAPWEAALWGVFAGLARFSSIAIMPWLLLAGLRGERSRSALVRAAGPALSPLVGVLIFMTYLQVELGDGLAYFHELRHARFSKQGLFVGVGEIGRELAHLVGFGSGVLGPHLWFAFAMVFVAFYARLAYLRLRDDSELGPALYLACGWVLALTSSLAAQPRYLWLLFPAAPMIARMLEQPRPRPRSLLIAIAAGVLVVVSIGFSRWYYLT